MRRPRPAAASASGAGAAWAVAMLGVSVAALLAGCSASSPDAAAAAAGASGGRVEGVVVTAAIAPLEGAAVALLPGGRTAVSAADGRFAFEGVPDGEYLLTATRPGYLAAQATARVASGAATPALVQVVLDADRSTSPYVEAYSYQGFLDFSARAGPLAAAGGGFFGEAALGTGYTLASRLPAWVQAEMVWTATQGLARSMLLTATPQNGSTLQTVGVNAEGPSPLMLGFDTSVLEGWGLQGGQALGVSAFVGNATPPPAPAVGVAAQQPFAVYTHFFYGYLPPDGWRFTADGDAPPPPA